MDVIQTKQDHLFGTLVELRRRYSEWRLGQLIANIADWNG
jgi:hypothetical protein